MLKEVFALRGQTNPLPDAIKKEQAKLDLERMNLSRGRGLSHVEPAGCSRYAAGISYCNKSAQLMEVHFFIIRFLYQNQIDKFIGHITRRLRIVARHFNYGPKATMKCDQLAQELFVT